MKRKHAAILSILITLLIATNVFLFQNHETRKTILVTRVIDGDTFKSEDENFRLVNINTPEKSEKGYEEAKQFLLQFENKTIEIEELSTDKYGRTLVKAYNKGYINLQIIQEGLGKKFLVQDSETSLFDEAEKSAVEKEKGLWEKSTLFGCLETEVFPSKEFLKITSRCGTLNIKDFIVADESRKSYKFPDVSILEVNLHSLEGIDNGTDLFWNSKSNIWNNDRDTAYMFDSEGLLVYHDSYGY
jgi:endonuclease YncB( thermonuclease family)